MRDTRLHTPRDPSHLLAGRQPSRNEANAVQRRLEIQSCSEVISKLRPPLFSRSAIAPLQPFSYCSVLLAPIRKRSTRNRSSWRDEWNWPAALHWAPTRILSILTARPSSSVLISRPWPRRASPARSAASWTRPAAGAATTAAARAASWPFRAVPPAASAGVTTRRGAPTCDRPHRRL